MSVATAIPAFQCSVGDTRFYICALKYGDVARHVISALDSLENDEILKLARGGTVIKEHLLKSPIPFLQGIVLAAWGGSPIYTRLCLDDPTGLYEGMDRALGVLKFDGTQRLIALDGQRQLLAMKEALNERPEMAANDICVIVVAHNDTPEGRTRTRRLFTNINRKVKRVGVVRSIALDEDDAYAIHTRHMLEKHEFLRGDEG